MSLQDWLNEDKLSSHTTNPKEIESLFKVIDRDIADAGVTAISADRRFATAYNAALQLATVVLLASDYRVAPLIRAFCTCFRNVRRSLV